MLLSFGPSLPLAVALLTHTIRNQVYALPSQQQQVLSQFAGAEVNGEGKEAHGLLRRFLAKDVDVQEVLQFALKDELDIWQVTPDHVDIYFPPSTSGLSPSLTSDDGLLGVAHTAHPIQVPAPYASSHPKHPAPTDGNWTSSPSSSVFHNTYHPLAEIESFMHELARDYPGLVDVIRVGISGEGRELLGVRIGGGAGHTTRGRRRGRKGRKGKSKSNEKMGFVVTGAQHAREWVATSTTLYLMHALVTDAADSDSLSSLLDHFTFYIIPTPNPDGYAYTWESDRFWYKNRMRTGPNPKCIGLDMNRNWGYKWRPTVFPPSLLNSSLESQSADDPCSQWYPGNRPFQAPEVNHIATYIEALPNLRAFVDMRSYGQMLSSPFSYSCKKLAQDAENQLEAALGAVSALHKAHATTFVTGSLCSMFYRAHGNIVDWMYKRAGITYAYAAHLRDTGTYGFALPPHFIRPVGEETANMIEYLAKFIVLVEK